MASQVVLSYLEIGGPTISLRGLQKAGQDEATFWVQLTFSSCAGVAQVSSDVAAHWAESWQRERWPEIRDSHLVPFGFHPDPPGPKAGAEIFVPADDLGYLRMYRSEDRAKYQLPLFELDQSIEEASGERAAPDELERRFGQLADAPTCRCQLCERSTD